MTTIELPVAGTSSPAPDVLDRLADVPPGTDVDGTSLVGERADEATAPTRWYRPASLGVLLATAVAYLWGLSASGWSNAFYSAAVQAGARSWKAMFFGSFDSANAITVDKPPAALWVMSMSARIFGVNSWSILVPEALMGVATVALVMAIVKRWFHPAGALAAGLVVATTPIAALMFRFNNPDALLVLLLTAAAYTLIRAIEDGRSRWLVLTGTLIGFGFLTKMLQAFAVVPPFALAYFLAAPGAWKRRLVQVVQLGVAPSCRPVGGWPSSSCGRSRAGPTPAARSTTACSS